LSTATATVKRAVYDLPLTAPQPAEAALPPAVAMDGPLLLQHALWFCKLRWLVVAAMLALAATAALGGDWLPRYSIRLVPYWPLGVAGVLALANVGFLIALRAERNSPRLALLVHRGLWLQILIDLAVLTAVVHWLGSVETVAPLMYLFHIVLACIFFSSWESLAITCIALAMYLGCVVLETAGIVPPRSIWTVFPPARAALPAAVLASHVASVAFISLTIWFLASRLAGELQRRDAELAATNQRLLAATDERARHMLQTTHQLKAPFAAIHANTQLLLGGFCGQLPEEAAQVVAQISARCDMLSRQIKAMLQLANLRSQAQTAPQAVDIELHEVIRGCLAALQPVAAKRGICFVENLPPTVIQGVRDHVVMMIDNIISNAVAYSQDGQKVTIACRPQPAGSAVVTVEDAGIGIPTTKLPLIFDDYFRTADAVKHNKASTGLGLAIVRQVAVAGKVGVRVESAPQQGTLFTLDFPPHWGERSTKF
jgi:signal transduction histidine kinase